jgi:hypothetical protein
MNNSPERTFVKEYVMGRRARSQSSAPVELRRCLVCGQTRTAIDAPHELAGPEAGSRAMAAIGQADLRDR